MSYPPTRTRLRRLLSLAAAFGAAMLLCGLSTSARAAEEAPAVKPVEPQTSVAGTPVTPVLVTAEHAVSLEVAELPEGLTPEVKTPGAEVEITGTPKHAETKTVKVTAKNAEGAEATETFEWTVTPEPPAAFEAAILPQTDAVGTAIAPVDVKGTHLAELLAQGLPAGLELHRVSEELWEIVGTPTTPKAATKVTLEAFDKEGAGPVATEFEWTIEPEGAAVINAPPAQSSLLGAAIEPLRITGANMHTLLAEGLPPGLSLEPVSQSEARITGTPTQALGTVVTLRATNPEGAEVVVTFSWTVHAPAPPGPAATGTLAVSPGVVFSAAHASCGGVSWSPATVTTQWLLDGSPIAGATAGTYVPPRLDDGRMLSCRQTATAGGASTAVTSAARVVHEQPPQPSWPIGPAASHCTTAVCMQEGAAPGAVGESYPQGGSWWRASQVRCVSAPWTSIVGDSPQAAVRAFAEAGAITVSLQRITSSGPVTVASEQLGGLGAARDGLEGSGPSPFGGAIAAPFGDQPFAAGELWSRRFPAAAGHPDWFAPGGGLLLYAVAPAAGTVRSFQLTYTLSAADAGSRLRCVASALDGPPGASTTATFASPEYAVGAASRCAPRRVGGLKDPQPAIVEYGDPRCLAAPSSTAAIGSGFQGVAVKGSHSSILLACGMGGSCRGRLELRAGASTLASAHVKLGRGSSRLVRLKLGKHGRRLVRARGSAGLPAAVWLGSRRLATVELLG